MSSDQLWPRADVQKADELKAFLADIHGDYVRCAKCVIDERRAKGFTHVAGPEITEHFSLCSEVVG